MPGGDCGHPMGAVQGLQECWGSCLGALSLAQAWRRTPGILGKPPRVVPLSVLCLRTRLAQSLRGDRVSTQELCISGSWRGKEEPGRNAERIVLLLGKGALQAKNK